MEKKLKEYRAKQRKQAIFETTKLRLRKLVMWNTDNHNPQVTGENTPATLSSTAKPENTIIEAHSDSDISSNLTNLSDYESPYDTAEKKTTLDYLLNFLYFIFWVSLYLLCINLGFGTVYFMLSLLVGIYINTRTRPRAPGEISAYSVFNKNCEAIDGTLKAEQFEQEIRFGPGAVR